MITHNMQDAINYGNRLIMLHAGEIIFDIKEKDKKILQWKNYLKCSRKKMQNCRIKMYFKYFNDLLVKKQQKFSTLKLHIQKCM